MARIYSNENFPLPAVEELRRFGHDVLTVVEAGQSNQAVPDEQVLDYAAKEGRILLTINRRHFVRLHEERPAHSGIIAATLDQNFAALASRIDAAILEIGDLAGKLVRVNRPAK